MESIVNFLSVKVKTYVSAKKTAYSNRQDILSVSVTALNKLKLIVNYFNIYPLLGVKGKDFLDWEIGYILFLNK